MSDAEDFKYLWSRREALRLRALTNRLYQQDRWRILERREGLVKAASLIAGSVALTRVVDPGVVNGCIAVIFAGTAASLVFGWGQKARDAAKRASEWTALERDMEQKGERGFTEADLNTWAARANDVEAGEPAMNSVLFERAYQRACKSLGATPESEAGWWDRNGRPILIP